MEKNRDLKNFKKNKIFENYEKNATIDKKMLK